MLLTDVEAAKLAGVTRAALGMHRSRAARKAVSLACQGVVQTAEGIRYEAESFIEWLVLLRGEEAIRKHFAQLEEAAANMLNHGRAKAIEDPVIERMSHEMADSLITADDYLVAARALALGEAIVTKIERKIGRAEALAYASAVVRRVGYLIAKKRKKKSRRFPGGKGRGGAK